MRSAGVPRTVLTAVERADGQVVAPQGLDRLDDVADEFRHVASDGRSRVQRGPLLRDFHLGYVAALLDGGVVHVDDLLALLAVGLVDRLLHLFLGRLVRNHAGHLEESALHDRIGPAAESDLGGDLRRVDDVEVDMVLGHIFLHRIGQMLLGRLGIPHAVEQERASVLEPLEQVVLAQIRRNVAGHEVGRVDQIGRADRLVAEAQVRGRVAARLLRVVREVGLAVFVGRVADDLDRVLVGAHRAVGAQADEAGLERAGVVEMQLRSYGQRGESHVVDDAHREVVLRLVGLQVLVDGQHLGRGRVLRRKAVASADDQRGVFAAVEYLLDIQIQRLAVGSGFFRAVEHADSLDRSGQHVEQVLRRERTVEVNGDETCLFALAAHVIDRFLDRFVHGAHGYDDVFGIRVAVVGERLVLASGDRADLLHRVGHHVGYGVVELVRGLAGLEVDVGVLSRAARDGVLRIERALAESVQRFTVEQACERLLVDHLDFLNFVRGAESVEEVQERNARADRHQMGDAGQVHHFLYAARRQHGETGLAGGHHVLMVAEDRQRLRGQCAGRNVEHARQQLAGYLVHVRNHQQQSLRGRERRSQRAALQRAVHRSGGSGLRLHFDNLDRFAENVLATAGRPLVDVLRHGGRRCDRIDRSHLAEHVCDVGRRVVSVTSNEFFLCHLRK